MVLTHSRETINVPVEWIREFNCSTWQRDTTYKCFVSKNWKDGPDFGAPARKLVGNEAGVYEIHIKNVFGEPFHCILTIFGGVLVNLVTLV